MLNIFQWKILLSPFMVLYAFGLFIHKLLYHLRVKKTTQLPGIVYSVGNIVAGGTGKSPFVIALVRYLVAHNRFPVILTRGYKSGLGRAQGVVLLNGQVVKSFGGVNSFHADEAMMQSMKLPETPIIVCSDRSFAALWYMNEMKQTPICWILDDGFQHWKIARNFDFVLLDASSPFSNGFLLPVGLLREPKRALRRANAIFFTRSNAQFPVQDDVEKTQIFAKDVHVDKLFFKTCWPKRLESKGPIVLTENEGVVLISAIAQPERLRDELKNMGMNIDKSMFLPDHTPFEINKILEFLGTSKKIITTEKDLWRDSSIFDKLENEFQREVYIAELEIVDIEIKLKQTLTL